MNNHTCRFVNNHQVVVLVDHLKRNILRFDRCIVMRTIKHECNNITRANLIIALDRFVVYMYKAGISCLLNTVTT